MMEDKMIKTIAVVTTRKLHLYDSIIKKRLGKEMPYNSTDKLRDCIMNLDYSLFLTDKEKQEKTIEVKTDLREILAQNSEILDTINKETY